MMHSGSAQSQSEPLLGPPQWQASKVGTPVPACVACAKSADAQDLLVITMLPSVRLSTKLKLPWLRASAQFAMEITDVS